MPITRINHFEAVLGEEATLAEFLAGVVSLVKVSPGCHSVELLASIDAPQRFAIVEVWESIEAHHAAAHQIPPDRLAAAMPLLAAKPHGENYRAVASGATGP